MPNNYEETVADLRNLLTGKGEKLKQKYGEELVNEFHELATGDPRELQKKYQNEAYEKYLDTFSSTRHLWRLDDHEWISHRKKVWDKIVARETMEDGDEFIKSYWDEAGRFFIRAKPRKK